MIIPIIHFPKEKSRENNQRLTDMKQKGEKPNFYFDLRAIFELTSSMALNLDIHFFKLAGTLDKSVLLR